MKEAKNCIGSERDAFKTLYRALEACKPITMDVLKEFTFEYLEGSDLNFTRYQPTAEDVIIQPDPQKKKEYQEIVEMYSEA